MTRTFTGRHITIILVAFFGVVMVVNFTMAYFASATFGGLVVENSYVASQKYNGWLEQAREQKALGWSLDIARGGKDRLEARMASEGQPLTDAHIVATARHPLGRLPDVTLRFRSLGDGRYESLETLPAGRWIVHLQAQAHGREIKRIVDLS
ncbi:MAG: FixH family protein [Sphingomonas sp.]|nr:FixH family protein [Sphingomonas sp.]